MKVAIYSEQCTRAGQAVGDRDLEEHGDDCMDWHVYEGEASDLLEIADLKEQHARSGGGGSYDRRVATTLRREVYAVHPEFEPTADTNE